MISGIIHKRCRTNETQHLNDFLKIYSASGHPRCRWVCFFIRTYLEKCSFTSLAHKNITKQWWLFGLFTCKWDSIVLQQIMVHYFVSFVDFLTQNLAVISTFHAWYEISVNLSWRPDINVSELCCCFDARERLVTLCWITSSIPDIIVPEDYNEENFVWDFRRVKTNDVIVIVYGRDLSIIPFPVLFCLFRNAFICSQTLCWPPPKSF